MSPRRRRLDAGSLSLLVAGFMLTACNDPDVAPLALGLQVPPPDIVGFKIQNYLPQPGRVFKDVFVSNFSLRIKQGEFEPMTARDGLPDKLKAAHNPDYGFFMNVPDSNGDGYSDLTMWLAGVQIINQVNLFCGNRLRIVTANDAFIYNDTRLWSNTSVLLGYRDCEKLYLNLNPRLFDYDGDGVPDYLEVRCGMNPRDPNDAFLSPAGDGVPNIEKCKKHIPIDEDANSQPNRVAAYKYQIDLSPGTGSRNITVSNIPILNGGTDTFIAFYITEEDVASHKAYLNTAFTILKPGTAGNTYKFDYWGVNPANATNQELNF